MGAAAPDSKYTYYKWTIFGVMYMGYTLYVLDRKAFSFAAPAIVKETGMGKADLGLIASSQNIAYTMSKFLGGIVSDQMGARTLFSAGLFLSGLVTILFTMFDSVPMFALMWFCCGLVQGGGWPACANVLRHWFPASEFGTYFGVLSTAMNLACSIGPILATSIILVHGWRVSFVMFGTLSIGMTAVCWFGIIDTPEQAGITGVQTMATAQSDKGKATRGRGSWTDLLVSPLMLTLCSGYCIIFLVRTALLDWAQLYLIDDCDQSPYIGSLFISCLETGGILGSVAAGILGDKAVAMMKAKSDVRREDTRGSPRMLVLTGFVAGMILALQLLLSTVDHNTHWLYTLLVGVFLGFFLYGPIALYGVIAMEAAPSHLTGTSSAINSLAANVGGIFAGLPFATFAKHYEWSGGFWALQCALIAVFIMQLLTRNMEFKMVPVKKRIQ